ncbi:MAG: rhodanese-related sulfurtransferase [Parachlamydiaceae bacterium]|nr:rhodanese-related sulfurtransferase [Parachlamydiaceae bacterium]
MKTEKPYLVLAYYHFVDLENPHEEVALHKAFFANRDVTCRTYISEQGINGQMSAAKSDAIAYMEWMHARPLFKSVVFKRHESDENVFPRITVKYRKQLAALDAIVDPKNCGEHVSPEEWKEMLQKTDDQHVLLDIRNEYEWKIGRFEGAELPPCDTFREFRTYAEELKEKVDPEKTPVMMYCTGGIRCELFSAVLKENGFEKVYQLDGGIINYGLQKGNDHWLGKLFVFDDRLAVPLAESNQTVISSCHHCHKPNDTYYNCANMDCNTLFLCCPDCLPKYAGCCKEGCKDAERVRPYHQLTHKPFRKKHNYSIKDPKKD